MDGGERRGSQYGTPYQTPGSRRPGPGQPMGPPSDTRHSQSGQSPARSDVARSAVARPYVPGYGYAYQDPQYHTAQMHSSSPMQGVELQYTPTYVQDPSRNPQMHASPSQHHYPSYGQSPMLSPGGQQPVYEGLQQYHQQQRQSAAIEVMASQFGGLPSYMQHGEHGSVGVGAGPSQFMTTQPEQSSYGAMPMSRPQLQPPFTTPTTEYQILETLDEPQDEGISPEDLEEGRRQYEQQLRATFTAIAAGQVTDAAEKLSALTRWLLSSIRALGLHHDEEGKHAERITFWREFNHAWEALGQKQKDITEAAIRNQRQPRQALSATTITTMVDELIRLCDQIEKYGLVDYELGVWEEQIIGVYVQCLEMLHPDSERREFT